MANYTTDRLPDVEGWKSVYRARLRHGSADLLLRPVKLVLGLSAAAAAASLWLFPGSNLGADVFAMKIAVSLVFAMAAVLLMQGTTSGVEPEIHVDFNRSEVRVVHLDGQEVASQRVIPFDELGAMQVRDHSLHVFTVDGDRLAILELDEATQRLLAA